MLAVHPAPDAHDRWFTGWTGRLQEWYSRWPDSPEWINHQVARMQSGNAEREVFQLSDDDTPIGMLVTRKLAGAPGTMLCDIHIEPEYRRRGHGRAALNWAKERWADLSMSVNAHDPAHQALFGATTVKALNMVKVLNPSDISAVAGRPMTDAEYVTWRDHQVQGYADQIERAGLLTAQQALAQSIEQFDGLLPDGLHTPKHAIWCIDADGEVAATQWLGHHFGPGTTWVCSVDVAEQHRGKGLGKAAMLLAERATIDAGDTRIGLNVFGYNQTAINLYRKLGYETTHEYRAV